MKSLRVLVVDDDQDFAESMVEVLEARGHICGLAHSGEEAVRRFGDEAAKSQWRSYTYRGIAANLPGANVPTNYNEFSFGLLDAGEILLPKRRKNKNT